MMDIEEIVEVFDFLGDWDQRYQYLIELGGRMEALPEADRTEQYRVKACVSQLWVKAYADAKNRGLLCYRGDCDTAVIKGVLALLIDLLSGKSPEQVLGTDVDALFRRLKLGEHLSPNRHVGIYAIVDQMKTQAAQLSREAA